WPTCSSSPRCRPTSPAIHNSRSGIAPRSTKSDAKHSRPKRDWPSTSSPTEESAEGKRTMSGAGFHVHGPHDHELEHAAQHGDKDRFAGTIAVMTAVLATIGALFAYMGGATQANAGLYKNNA